MTTTKDSSDLALLEAALQGAPGARAAFRHRMEERMGAPVPEAAFNRVLDELAARPFLSPPPRVHPVRRSGGKPSREVASPANALRFSRAVHQLLSGALAAARRGFRESSRVVVETVATVRVDLVLSPHRRRKDTIGEALARLQLALRAKDKRAPACARMFDGAIALARSAGDMDLVRYLSDLRRQTIPPANR